METPPRPSVDLSPLLYRQLVYTLTDLLPPPLDSSPEALRARNHAAVAKVAALLPVNANEIDLAAQCIVARGQAEEMLRLIRQHAGDIGLVLRLNAQYASMVRTSLSVHGRLMRVQAMRQKREAIEGAATEDSWTQHVTERSMLKVADPGTGRVEAAPPPATPVKVPSARANQREKNVSKYGSNSHSVAFETVSSETPKNQGPEGSGQLGLYPILRTAMARSGLTGQAIPANGRESAGGAVSRGHDDRQTASA